MKKEKRVTDKWWTGKVYSRDVGQQLRIVPYWERYSNISERISIILDPGPSFGAGDHPTTLMALELTEQAISLAQVMSPRPTLLDVGTGTGILAIASKLLGSGLTIALDIDPVSIYITRRNMQLNGLMNGKDASRIVLVIGGAEAVKGLFDIVVANLAAPTLLRLHYNLKSLCKNYLVLSGIADAMIEEILNSYSGKDLRLMARKVQNNWHSVLFERL